MTNKGFIELRIAVPAHYKNMDEWADYVRRGEFVLFGWVIHDDRTFEELKAKLPKLIYKEPTPDDE